MRRSSAPRRRFAAGATILALTLTACGTTPESAAPSDGAAAGSTSVATASAPASIAPSTSPSPAGPAARSRDDAWRADIDALLTGREAFHPDPWHGMARADWVAAADAAKARIPTLSDDAALVELVRLAAMPGWAGRDGHTGIFPFQADGRGHAYPIRLWQFPEGLVITTATEPYADLAGSRILAIDGHPIDDVMALVEPLSPRDNPTNLLAFAPLYLRVPELLVGLGVVPDVGPATFTVVDRDGRQRDVGIEPITSSADVAWHGGVPLRLPAGDARWLRDQDQTLWWTVLKDSNTMYIQYNEVQRGIEGEVGKIQARIKEGGIERVVIDLRTNLGGDNNTYFWLIRALQDPSVDRPGRLFALIGRLTFSAAANFATDLESTTSVRFVGEPLGGSPNLYGDVAPVPLPASQQTYFVATRYHEKGGPNDTRITIDPDIAVPYTTADWLAARDPVLEAAIEAPTD